MLAASRSRLEGKPVADLLARHVVGQPLELLHQSKLEFVKGLHGLLILDPRLLELCDLGLQRLEFALHVQLLLIHHAHTLAPYHATCVAHVNGKFIFNIL